MSTTIINRAAAASAFSSLLKREKGIILLVSDVHNSRLLIRTHLSSAGHRVVVWHPGDNVITMAQEHQTDIVILDMPLLHEDGYVLCRLLKKNPKTELIPVVLLTEYFHEETADLGYSAGADDFLNKPVNRLELLARIRSLIRIKHLYEALEEKILELENTQNRLQELVIRDELSGVYNYRFFQQQLHQEILRSLRFEYPVSLIIMDIDNFKKYNDQFGHPQGDKIIKRFASLIKDNIRKVDILSRYGGDEFALILPNTSRQAAISVADKLRSVVEHAYFPGAKRAQKGITLSAGVASYPADAMDAEELLQLSDIALYMAKEKGKNQIASVDSVHDSN
ncbi:diguanylate cyclase [bacterium]|nr:diguanylate cyclase [bacterium]